MNQRFNRAYLGKRLQDLMDLAHVQMQKVYKARGLDIPVEGSSTLQMLGPDKVMAIADIARALDQSHQLISQRVDKLLKRGLLSRSVDPNDARRTEYRLSPIGLEQWLILDQIMREADAANRVLFTEIEVDLVEALENAMSRLRLRGLDARILGEAGKE